MYTCVSPCTTKITDVGMSSAAETSGSTPTGRVVSTLYEATPHSGGYSQTVATVASNGVLGALSGQGTGYTMPAMTYGLDGEGRSVTATDTTHATNLVTATAYNVAGGATQVTFGNGDKDTSGYDAYYRGNGFSFAVAASTPYTVSGALTLNANSTVKAMAITDTNDTTKNQSCSYSADDLNRLKTANCGTVWSQTFSYDPYGNISKAANGGTTYAATYGTQNRVVSGTPATYDANGNQTMSVSGSFGFNAAGQMVSATAGSTTSQATYDALGRMVETVSGSSNTQFVYSPLGTQYAVVQNGTLLRGTVPLPGGDTAVYNSAGLNYIRHTDLLGSSRLATTWAHAVYSKNAYAPYGEPYDETATKDRSFTGQGSDITSNVGVFDFQFRKLETTAGRWLSPDPSGWNATDLSDPQSFNRYAYAENSPLMSVDPLGLLTYTIATYTCAETVTQTVHYTADEPFGLGPGVVCTPHYLTFYVPDWFTPPGNTIGFFGSATTSGLSFFVPPQRVVSHAPAKVGCSTVLPNGKTLGQYINQGRAQMQASVNAGGAFNGGVLATFASIARDYGQIDFKNGAAGTSVLATNLGQAGNFAYYAIGSGYLSPGMLNAGAGAYGIVSALLGKKPFSSLTGPMYSDASANSVRNAGLATPGCPQ